MRLIADSGSTHTDWCLLTDQGESQRFRTNGINPFMQQPEEIRASIQSGLPLHKIGTVDAIWFYGAGCINEEKRDSVKQVLRQCFNANKVEVDSDLLAAARSLCGKSPGIACILGTGSNSCYYDGNQIVDNVSPLGFILGDEGSGAVLGKRLIGDILKNQLPGEVIQSFYQMYPLSSSEILQKVYREPFPNRYLAGFSRFIAQHLEEPAVRCIVSSEFKRFIERNVLQYSHSMQLELHFTGSIAYYFSSVLKEVLLQAHLKCGRIEQSPMSGLINYHQNKLGY